MTPFQPGPTATGSGRKPRRKDMTDDRSGELLHGSSINQPSPDSQWFSLLLDPMEGTRRCDPREHRSRLQSNAVRNQIDADAGNSFESSRPGF